MNKTQKGFALFEGLLIFIIIAVIAGVGWYAIHTKHQTDKILSQANKISQSTPIKPKQLTKNSNPKTLTIKEWGISASYTADVTLQYKVVTQNGQTWAYITSDELVKANSNCTVDTGSGGVILRYASGDFLRNDAGEASAETVNQAISKGDLKDYSHVGNYYYFFEKSHANCAPSQSTQVDNLQSQTFDAANLAASKFVTISQ